MNSRLMRAGVALAAGLALALPTAVPSVASADEGPPAQEQSSSAAVDKGWGKRRTPGVPQGGPGALYAPPPKLPMTSNRDPRFRAPFNLVSGSERYVGGEYTYTGYAYDDDESTYPNDFARYANNSANLVEFRIAPYRRGTLYRFTFLTLLHKDTTLATVAFNTDEDDSTGSATLPKDPGLPFPGTDQVLTTWGTGASWSVWDGSRWRHRPLRVRTDLTSNQMTIAVPHRVVRPAGAWTATLATGIYDPATKGWMDIAAASRNTTNIVNLGFRFNETRETRNGTTSSSDPTNFYNLAPWEHQSMALKAGTPTVFAHPLRFDWLRRGKAWNNIPNRGAFLRMAPSFLAGGTANTGNVPSGISWVDALGTEGTTVVHEFRTEGKDRSAWETQYYSPLHPYVIYIPEHYEPGIPSRLTFWLHPDGGEYYGFGTTFDIPKVWGDARNSIMIDPLARSYTNFFLQEQEQALFEVWNDVARHYTLDPDRTVAAGGSGGGFGAYNLGTMWPQLFASVVSLVPGGQRGIYIPGVSDGNTVLNDWLPNLRNLPVYHLSDMFSELTFYPGNVQNALGPSQLGNSLEQLKYRYLFKSVAKDHLLIDFDRPHVASWMGDRKVEQRPFHVTYVRQPSNDTPAAGIVHNKAYWLSNIEIRDNSERVAKGTIDAVSHGFGLTDADTQLETPIVYTDSPGNIYATVERTWGPFKPARREDKLVINATNIRAVTIDARAARLTCDAEIQVISDGPIEIRLKGCPR